MRKFKTLFVGLVFLLLPVTAAFPVLPELGTAVENQTNTGIPNNVINNLNAQWPNPSDLPPAEALSAGKDLVPADQLIAELESYLEGVLPSADELVAGEEQIATGFWTRGKVIGISAFVASMLALVLSLSAGGSGSGILGIPPFGFTGSPTPPVPPGPPSIIIPPPVPPTTPDKTTDSNGGEIPHHPEPSTLLLLGSGLMLTSLLRRKRRY